MKRLLITTILLGVFSILNLNAQDIKHDLTPQGGFENFNAIQIDGVYQVKIEQGPQAALYVFSPDTMAPGLKFAVENSKLKIKAGTKRPVSSLYIIYTDVEEIKLGSAVELGSVNTINTDYLHLILNGASEIDLDLDVDFLKVDIGGAAELNLAGRADSVDASILGAAEYTALELATISTRINVTGAADAKINARDELIGKVSGAGSISYETEPAFVDIKKTGAADIGIVEGPGDTIKLKVGSQEITIFDDDHEKPAKKKSKFNGHWGGVELHMNTYLDPNNEIFVPAPYGFLEPDLSHSIGFSVNLFEQNFNLIRNHLGLTTGLGFTYNNYRFDPDVVLLEGQDAIAATIDTTYGFEKSKLRVNHLTIPLILEYQTNNKEKLNSFHVGTGVIFGYNIGARTKNMYFDKDERIKFKTKGDFNLNPIRLEATARIGWGKLNIFANYDLLPMFKEGEGPELYPLTAGISLVGW